MCTRYAYAPYDAVDVSRRTRALPSRGVRGLDARVLRPADRARSTRAGTLTSTPHAAAIAPLA